MNFTEYLESMTDPIYEANGEPQCPPGYKFDKKALMCVPKTAKDAAPAIKVYLIVLSDWTRLNVVIQKLPKNRTAMPTWFDKQAGGGLHYPSQVKRSLAENGVGSRLARNSTWVT